MDVCVSFSVEKERDSIEILHKRISHGTYYFFFFGQKSAFMVRIENVKIREFCVSIVVPFLFFKIKKYDEKSNKNIIIIDIE